MHILEGARLMETNSDMVPSGKEGKEMVEDIDEHLGDIYPQLNENARPGFKKAIIAEYTYLSMQEKDFSGDYDSERMGRVLSNYKLVELGDQKFLAPDPSVTSSQFEISFKYGPAGDFENLPPAYHEGTAEQNRDAIVDAYFEGKVKMKPTSRDTYMLYMVQNDPQKEKYGEWVPMKYRGEYVTWTYSKHNPPKGQVILPHEVEGGELGSFNDEDL